MTINQILDQINHQEIQSEPTLVASFKDTYKDQDTILGVYSNGEVFTYSETETSELLTGDEVNYIRSQEIINPERFIQFN